MIDLYTLKNYTHFLRTTHLFLKCLVLYIKNFIESGIYLYFKITINKNICIKYFFIWSVFFRIFMLVSLTTRIMRIFSYGELLLKRWTNLILLKIKITIKISFKKRKKNFFLIIKMKCFT